MKRKDWVLILFIFTKFLLQYVLISSVYELHRDEYLYLDQAHHLAWGYLSVPPVSSWISTLIYFLGNSVFLVKFFPAFFGALTLIVVWKTIEELKGDLFALILGATCVLFSALLRLNTLYQPNSLDVLCWVSIYYLIIRYFNTASPKWLFTAAAVFALGFLNKYNIVFLIVGLFPAILLTSQRKMFLKKELYLALLVGLVLISPNLWWQYQNDFPVVHHMQQLRVTQLVHVDRASFLWSQILFFAGSLHVLLAGVLALLFYGPFRKQKAFFWALIFTLIIFIYFRAKDYYAIGLYPIYLSFGAVFLADALKEGWRQYLKPVALLIPLLVFIPIFQIAFPNRSPDYVIAHSSIYQKYGMLRWEDGKDHALPQDFADMLGWKELARKVDSVYSQLPNADRTLILCDNYGQAGAINYYGKLELRAVSFNADYVNWFDLGRPYLNLIRVKEHEDNSHEFEETSPYFNKAVLADSINNPYAREYKTMIFAFIGAKVAINQRIEEEVRSAKRRQ